MQFSSFCYSFKLFHTHAIFYPQVLPLLHTYYLTFNQLPKSRQKVLIQKQQYKEREQEDRDGRTGRSQPISSHKHTKITSYRTVSENDLKNGRIALLLLKRKSHTRKVGEAGKGLSQDPHPLLSDPKPEGYHQHKRPTSLRSKGFKSCY